MKVVDVPDALHVIKHKLPKDREVKILAHSDTHVGSKSFHEKKYKALLDRLDDEPWTFATHGGDVVEGKKVDSPHFEPDGLVQGQLIAGKQYRHFRKLIEPVADKFLQIQLGNHDLYHLKASNLLFDIVCEPLDIPCGSYQNYVSYGNGVIAHYWHGRPSLPRGAKDPIQREGNQRAWLKNKAESLFMSADIHFMGHIHELIVQPPLEQKGLSFHNGKLAHSRFTVPPQFVTDSEGKRVRYVPETSRWYATTGTFRTSGGEGWVDYAEIAGYPPSDIGCIEVTMADGHIRDVKPWLIDA